MMNFKQRWVIDQKNKKKWLEVCPTLTDCSGIYILTREENCFKYAYIGQSKKILTRLAEHLRGYQHIDLSLKNHGLYSESNRTGWSVDFVEYPQNQLDYQEQEYIKEYAKLGYQLRNKTTGSQGIGKKNIDVVREVGGYRRGVRQGYAKALKEANIFFDKYLDFTIKGKPNKIKERKFEEFKIFLGGTYENKDSGGTNKTDID